MNRLNLIKHLLHSLMHTRGPEGGLRGNRLHSRILYQGKCTYGLDAIKIVSFPGKATYLRIGSYCSIAANVTVLLGGEHRTDWLTTFPFGHIHQEMYPAGEIHGSSQHPASKGDVIIENDVWIGYGATILSVVLGSGCCIGAQSVISKSIPPYAIAAGNPARVVRYRFSQDIIDYLLDLEWWCMSDELINRLVPLLQSQPNEETFRMIGDLTGKHLVLS